MAVHLKVELYENMEQCWMVKVALESVDSPHGLAAYVAVLLRNNGIIRSYRLTKVVEHWNITPGDGNVYFACELSPLCTLLGLCLLPFHVASSGICMG